MISLKNKSDLHLARKFWHAITVSLMCLFYHLAPMDWSKKAIIAGWLLFVPADLLRLKVKALNDLAITLFKPVMRETELNKLAGTTYLLTGVLLVVFLFPKNVGLLAMLFLAFADPIASYFGVRFGRDKLFAGKSLQGFIAAFVVCSLISFLYFTEANLMIDRVIVASLLTGLIGALSELIPIGKLDDNLSLPILSSLGIYTLFYLFGAFSPVLT
jgi:diacylglycerol kinase (CTP)